jgi:hypothetical protein
MFASSQPARSVIEPLMPNSASRHSLRLMDHLLEVVGRAGARDVRCCLPGPSLCVITSLMIRRQSLSLPWRRPTHEGQMRATRHRVSSRITARRRASGPSLAGHRSTSNTTSSIDPRS